MISHQTIGLALSGSGPAGVGHIPALQGLDDLGVRPSAIAGTSVGALIGALYASGLSGDQIRVYFEQLGARPMRALLRIIGVGGLTLNKGVPAVHTTRFVNAIIPADVPHRIEDCEIDLIIIAGDFHAKSAVALRSGDLRLAIAASVAIPSVFCPVERDGRYYVDGGPFDNLPLTYLPETELTLAVNVFPDPPLTGTGTGTGRPGQIQAGAEAVRTLISRSSKRALAARPPDVYIETPRQRAGLSALWHLQSMIQTADQGRHDMVQQLSPLLTFESGAMAR